MPPSAVVQATQEAIESLHAAAARWGETFDTGGSAHAQLDAQADSVAAVFLAFNVAYASLPRFRTEPALRRFMEAMHELERSLKGVRLPANQGAVAAAAAATQGARQSEAAFSAISGKTIEPREAAQPSEPAVVQGSVYRLLSDRGYGFVRATGTAAEVFFTAQSVRGARFAGLREGQPVSFRVVPDPRVPGRMQAVEVQPLR